MRIEQLTFTRFIAAILIVIFHYGVDIFPFNLTKQLFTGANVGVSYFFVLSGFVMIIAYHKKAKISALSYLKNRFARIYPVYLLASILLIGYYLLATNLSVNTIDVLLNIFMIQSWIPGKALTLNFPGWSLSVELFFYLMFPILFNAIYRKFNYKKLIAPILIFFGISQIVFIYFLYSDYYQGVHTASHDQLFYFPLMHLNEFVMGNLAGLYFINKKNHVQKNYSIYILLLIISCGLLLSFDTAMKYHNGILSLLFIPLILFISSDNSWISKMSTHKWMVHLGEISYGVYILQIPVFVITRRVLIKLGVEDKTLIFYAGIVALLVFSSITYKYIEAPLRKRIKSLKFGNS